MLDLISDLRRVGVIRPSIATVAFTTYAVQPQQASQQQVDNEYYYRTRVSINSVRRSNCAEP